jgi:hypothetical protein
VTTKTKKKAATSPIFFNDILLASLEGLAQQNLEDISSKLKYLEETFKNRIEELKLQSVGNITITLIGIQMQRRLDSSLKERVYWSIS